jgi:large repetitive protein
LIYSFRMLQRIVLALVVLGAAACGDTKGLSVSEIEPNRGPFLGGERVHIKGTGFSTTGGMKVYFGKKPAKNPVIKEGEIVVEPPPGKEGETVDIEIVFDDSRELKISKAYTYYDPTK